MRYRLQFSSTHRLDVRFMLSLRPLIGRIGMVRGTSDGTKFDMFYVVLET
jgi:hypothetical protein